MGEIDLKSAAQLPRLTLFHSLCIGPKRHIYFYSLVLEFFLCYYIGVPTYRTVEEGVARVVTRGLSGHARNNVCSVLKVHRRAWPKDRGPLQERTLGPGPALNGPAYIMYVIRIY